VDHSHIRLEFLPQLLPNLLALVVSVVAMGLFWPLHRDARSKYTLWVAGMSILWNTGSVLIRCAGLPWIAFVGYQLTVVAALYTSAAVLTLSMLQVGGRLRLSPRATKILFVMPFVIMCARWCFGDISRYYVFEPGPPMSYVHVVPGPQTTWTFMIAVCGGFIAAGLLAQGLVGATSRLQRLQCATLLSLIILPFIAGTTQNLYAGALWTRRISVTGLILAGSATALLYLFSRDSRYHLMPIARTTLVESMQDGVVVSDATGRIVDINPAALALLAENGRDSIPLGSPVNAILGTNHWRPGIEVEQRMEPIRNGSEIAGYAHILRDVTDARRRERELREANRIAEQAVQFKSEFLANVSHEIRTPLNGVLGIAQMILSEPLPEALRHKMRILEASAESLRSIVDDVLDSSKIDSGHMRLDEKQFALPDVVADVACLFRDQANAKGVQLIFQPASEGMPRVMGDALRIRQVISNLIGNAVKFTSAGRVLVELSGHPHDGILYASIRIQDTGIGIDARHIDAMFERYVQGDASTTRQFGGTGLGLAISKKLVGLMNGRIKVNSIKGSGTEFLVELPLRLAPVDYPSGHYATPLPFPHLGARVLLAEDNPVNQFVASAMLRKLGCSVEIAENGEEAVEKASGDRFDLILMDCQMPELDGYAATRKLRDAGTRTPIIALTASCMDADRERCLEAGMDGFVAKPIDIYDLQRAIQGLASTRIS
jgi:signal transduction histidine kinase/CheY-like chemotaxis protein